MGTYLEGTNFVWESITMRGLKEKSERPIVVKKRGNACGAKGPYFSHVTNNIRRTA